MGLIFQSLGWDLAFFTTCFLVFVSWYYTTAFSYWSSRGVHSIKPIIFFGNTKDKILMCRSYSDVQTDLYRAAEGHKFLGFYDGTKPTLMVRDPEVIKNVLVRDFAHFTDRGFPDDSRDPIDAHLFALGGSRWRKLRTKLAPTFSPGKMRLMHKLMAECSEELVSWLGEQDIGEDDPVEIKEIASKYTMDVIGSCAFGLQIKAINSPQSEFREMARKVLEPSQFSLKLRILVSIFPFLGKILLPERTGLTDYFLKLVRDVMAYRENSSVTRNDYIQLLIQLKKYGKVEDDSSKDEITRNKSNMYPRHVITKDDSLEMTDNLLAAQCFSFLVAGLETSASTISCCLHELSLNTAIQDKLRREVDSVLRKHDSQLTHEALVQMQYLDQVLDETLRKYPPSGFLTRTCTRPYTIPASNVHIDKGTRLVVPVRSIHHDPKYFPLPERFDPDRFGQQGVKDTPQFTYMPFGEGPRLCIGAKFGRMLVKVAVAALLKNYEFSVCERTSVPLKFSPSARTVDTPTEVWLRLKKRPAARQYPPKIDIYERAKIQRDRLHVST